MPDLSTRAYLKVIAQSQRLSGSSWRGPNRARYRHPHERDHAANDQVVDRIEIGHRYFSDRGKDVTASG